jgi:hypothetical protein
LTPHIAILNKDAGFFVFPKNKEQEGKIGVGTSGKGEDIKKGCRRVNMVEIICTHV